MKKIVNLILILFLTNSIFAQKNVEERLRTYVNPAELVTLSENLSFNQAILILSKVSEGLTGKKIISTEKIDAPIGLKIEKMPYMRALQTIVKYHGLIYETTESSIIVKKAINKTKDLPETEYASVNAKEVKISAVFFELSVTELRERGFNWDWSISKDGLKIGTNLLTFGENQQNQENQPLVAGQQQQRPPEFKVNTESTFDMGEFSGEATAALKFFENENLGEVIAHPSITVRDRAKGRIQIGTDISIKQQDFAGNIIDNFISTGTIIEVTPYIYTEDGIDYVLLKLKVERSSGTPGQISTEIQKTMAETDILMLDGEETEIGGLYVIEESNERRGVPILKDLPWWFFGLKYLFGYESKQQIKKEVIILIKAELVPPLKERVKEKIEQIKIKDLHDRNEKRVKKYSIKENDKED